MARPKSNRDEVLMELYMSGMSVQECADEMGYTFITTRNKLSTLGVYDPPLTESDPLWKEWDKAVERLRRES